MSPRQRRPWGAGQGRAAALPDGTSLSEDGSSLSELLLRDTSVMQPRESKHCWRSVTVLGGEACRTICLESITPLHAWLKVVKKSLTVFPTAKSRLASSIHYLALRAQYWSLYLSRLINRLRKTSYFPLLILAPKS